MSTSELFTLINNKILEHLKLPEATGPAQWWLTEFEDNWSYQPAASDVRFRRSVNQKTVRRDQYAAARVPHDGAMYAFVGFAAFSSLLVRMRRRPS